MVARLTAEARELLEEEAQYLADMLELDTAHGSDEHKEASRAMTTAFRTLLDWYDQWVLDMEACKNVG